MFLNHAQICHFPFRSYGQVCAYDCELFTVSSCANAETEIKPPYPGLSEIECQDFCQSKANCLHYKHTTNKISGETECQFFTSDYTQECRTVGGATVRN